MFLQGQKIGKYEIIRSLGSGGFGSVFLAKDIWLDIKVAIKVPHKQSVELYKLLKEPRLQAVLDHPNIVRLLAAEKVDKVFFFVMEYVRGRTLEKILQKEKVLEIATAIDMMKQLAAGVEHAHKNKIIHRDLRPSNIIVSEEGQVKITDFGTSAWLQDVPYATTRIGSPPYMAPEQFMGKSGLACFAPGKTARKKIHPTRKNRPGNTKRVLIRYTAVQLRVQAGTSASGLFLEGEWPTRYSPQSIPGVCRQSGCPRAQRSSLP